MKLIDLLVQELPKRGGWPGGAHELFMHCKDSKKAYFYNIDGGGVPGAITLDNCGVEYEGSDEEGFGVTREQYEAALAAAQQPAWNGEGLPPVGCECERSWAGDKWLQCKIIFISDEIVLVKLATREAAYQLSDVKFRPIRSEADKKRDKIIEALAYHTNAADAANLYKAIEAGEVEGVKLDV